MHPIVRYLLDSGEIDDGSDFDITVEDGVYTLYYLNEPVLPGSKDLVEIANLLLAYLAVYAKLNDLQSRVAHSFGEFMNSGNMSKLVDTGILYRMLMEEERNVSKIELRLGKVQE